MFQHILVATDGSELADRAVSTALRLAGEQGARVTTLMVVPDYTTHEVLEVVLRNRPEFDELREALAAEGRRRLDEVVRRHPEGSRTERVVAVSDDPHLAIVQTADRLICDLIVVGSHGHGALRSMLIGSQTTKLLPLSKIPVLIVK